jgi:hypothetical protein
MAMKTRHHERSHAIALVTGDGRQLGGMDAGRAVWRKPSNSALLRLMAGRRGYGSYECMGTEIEMHIFDVLRQPIHAA